MSTCLGLQRGRRACLPCFVAYLYGSELLGSLAAGLLLRLYIRPPSCLPACLASCCHIADVFSTNNSYTHTHTHTPCRRSTMVIFNFFVGKYIFQIYFCSIRKCIKSVSLPSTMKCIVNCKVNPFKSLC